MTQKLEIQNAQINQKKIIVSDKLIVKKQIVWIFDILQFCSSFNYAVQNTLITMLMISFLTPDIIDSLIWIIPNIIAIIVRPYLIRYVHNSAITIYNQVKFIFYLMLFACIGTSLIAFSVSLTSKFFSIRIIVCSIGWTISGVCFDLITFFSNQLKTNLKESCYLNKGQKMKSQDINQSEPQNINFQNEEKLFSSQLIGYALGYLITFGIFFYKSSSNLKGFYSDSKLVYSFNAVVTFISAFAFYLISKTNIPSEDPEQKKRLIPFRISYDINYYLPGYSQLKSSSFATFQYLFVHFAMYFLVDIVTIYCTMWIAGSIESAQLKRSESYFFGIKFGVIYLLIFSFVSLTSIFDYFLKFISFQKLSLLISIAGISCWSLFNLISFMALVIGIGMLFRKYNSLMEDKLKQSCKMFQTCKQIVQRFGKIFVLCHMPFTIMILLGRDDIQDGILWGSILISLASLILMLNLKLQKVKKQITEQNVKQKQN